MARNPGRPLKYPHFIAALEDDTLYSPFLIYSNAEKKGLLSPEQLEDLPTNKVRVRHTMARFAVNHKFPKEGDGVVRVPGQSITVGWKGSRWKGAVPEKQLEEGFEILKRETDT